MGNGTSTVATAAARPKRKRRERGSIRAEDILAGAFEVAASSSLDQMSMPNLADHLDVAVTSIYWYFRKKEDLLNAMTDVALDKFHSRVPGVVPGDTWQEMLRNHFAAVREVYREDEVLTDLLLMRTSTYGREATHRTMEHLESLVAALVEAGFSPTDALFTLNAISVYTRGIVIHERVLQRAGAPTLDVGQRRITDWSDMPVLDGLIDDHPLAGTTDADFEFSVARLVAGFEALLTASPGSGRARRRVLDLPPAARGA